MSDRDLLASPSRPGSARVGAMHSGTHDVTPDTLRAVLAASGLPARLGGGDCDSRVRLGELPRPRCRRWSPPRSATRVRCPRRAGGTASRREDGRDDRGRDRSGRRALPPIDRPAITGWNSADSNDDAGRRAARCPSIADVRGRRTPWGLAVQLYCAAPRRGGGIGDFAALARFRAIGRRGMARARSRSARCMRSSPPIPDRFSPYAPSSRVMLNVLHAPLPDGAADAEPARLERLELVDWPAAAAPGWPRSAPPSSSAGPMTPRFARIPASRGDALETHARFEALHAHLFAADPGRWNWRDWPEEYRDPHAPTVERFAPGACARGRASTPGCNSGRTGLAAAQRGAARPGCRSA